MPWIDIAFRWMHIFSSLALVGGLFFLRFAYVPSLPQSSQGEDRNDVWKAWSKIVMISTGFLLLSGIVNLVRIVGGYSFPGKLYHPLIGTKFLLALPLFFIASVVGGRTALAAKVRASAKTWLNVAILLAVLIVCMAGVLKFVERVPKDAVSGTAQISQSA